MKRKSNNYRGSILASILALSLMYLTVFNFTFHRYQQQQTLVSDSIKYHKLETLKYLAQYYLQKEQPDREGSLLYSTGRATYRQLTKETYSLEVELTTGEKKVYQLVIQIEYEDSES